MPTLEDIRIYPVKGLRGFSVGDALVEPWGLEHDRRWMVVEPSGRFLTQREVPAMARVCATLVPGGLRLSVDGCASHDEPVPGVEADYVEVVVWDDTVSARAASVGAAAWLTAALGRPCRLVHMDDPAVARPVDPDYAGGDDRVSFADGFPLLVATTASLADLNRRLATPVGMDRFRPNVVVNGAEAWDEDGWSTLSIGGVAFAGVKDCARCVVTTVDQARGVKAQDGEPLRTLARFRRKPGGRIIFGQNLVPRGMGRIAVGDRVTVPAMVRDG